MYERRRNIVVRPDGRPSTSRASAGQLFVCATGCCCGRTEDGFARGARRDSSTASGSGGGSATSCTSPSAAASAPARSPTCVLLLFDGQAQWFHSIDSDALVLALYDHVEAMLEADAPLPPPPALAPYHFTASAWQPRPDGQPVDDSRPGGAVGDSGPGLRAHCRGATPRDPTTADARTRGCQSGSWSLGAAGVPRKNGELVFEEPWQGRVFGMAVALSEQGLVRLGGVPPGPHRPGRRRRGARGRFEYYEVWLAAFERVLAARGLVGPSELEETTYQFEFGERDDVF